MAVLERNPGESDYELVKRRLSARVNGTPMSREEANEILSDTTISILSDNGKYMYFAVMGEGGGYNTLRSALNDAIKYLENGGY